MVGGIGLVAVVLMPILTRKNSFLGNPEKVISTYDFTYTGIWVIVWKCLLIFIGLLAFIEGFLCLISILLNIFAI